jgi:hypothetical protein
LKNAIVNAVRKVPGVLPEPNSEALVMDVNPEIVKVRVLWSTHEARERQMLTSYDKVLTTIVEALGSDRTGAADRPAA